MSPRRSDPSARPALVDIAARILAEEGPQALSARRIASEVGTSTMALYTHFNGMRGLARAMVHEGFARLQHYFTRVGPTDDPVCDLALLGRAYRCNALANPHLYAVMFGGSSLAGFSLGEEDRQYGRYTLTGVAECAARCIEAGRFRAADAELVAHQMWSAVHGLVVLELGDYLIEPCGADRLLEEQLVGLMVGVGDTREAATVSVAASAGRLQKEVVAVVADSGRE
ncbi:TetR/AcrR family transcriptional regulator [Kitasatospora sp. HPMI-4]|uniref:TetR/AcrR family transcriptional regulator n=1 Tax=Kitasatospora sp. HPMI-4 TaxID=3448443 RepID=UPI003F1AAE6E